MRKLFLTIACSLPLLAGCAMFQKPYPGMQEAELTAIRGKPDFEYQEGDRRRLEWSATEMGQYAYMAEIGPDGRLVSFEQVLTDERFASLRIGQSTQADVIRTVGHPPGWNRWVFEDGERWSYRYKENGVWDAMMTVYFDRNGVVEAMRSYIDPLFLRD